MNLIPNVKNIFKILKKNYIKIGATTGYPKKITKIILSYLLKNKLNLDYCVSEDEVKKGRPGPDMCIKNLKNLKITNPKKCLKIDDSISGIVEGKKAKIGEEIRIRKITRVIIGMISKIRRASGPRACWILFLLVVTRFSLINGRPQGAWVTYLAY